MHSSERKIRFVTSVSQKMLIVFEDLDKNENRSGMKRILLYQDSRVKISVLLLTVKQGKKKKLNLNYLQSLYNTCKTPNHNI